MTYRRFFVPNEQSYSLFEVRWLKVSTTQIFSSTPVLNETNNWNTGNTSCYAISTNPTMLYSWQRFDCHKSIVTNYLCQRDNHIADQSYLKYELNTFDCPNRYVMLESECVKITPGIVTTNFTTRMMKATHLLFTYLSAWSLQHHSTALHNDITLWLGDDGCYTSTDLFFIQRKRFQFTPKVRCASQHQSFTVLSNLIYPVNSNCPRLYNACLDGVCVLALYFCDGKIDCLDKSDEIKCTAVCSQNEDCFNNCSREDCVCDVRYYQCLSGGCVKVEHVRDGQWDCMDGSDETPQPIGHYYQVVNYSPQVLTPNPRLDDWSLCHSYRNECYPNDKICVFERMLSGEPLYCSDTEHVRHCDLHLCPRQFKCPQSYCISLNMVCDGVYDCPEKEDELNCSKHSCQGLLKCRGKYSNSYLS